MKFKEYSKHFIHNLKVGISGFLTAFICSILCWLTMSIEIIFSTNEEKIIIPMCMTFVFVAVFSVFLKVVQEYMIDKLSNIIQYITCGIVAVVVFIILKINYESIYTFMVYAGILIALICFIFFALMRGKNKDLIFPKLVSSLAFTISVCVIISVGLSTCLAAFLSLVFDFSESYKLYSVVNLFVWIVGAVNIFLSLIPKKDAEISQSKIFKIFILYAGLPVYMLLTGILLLYLAKIVITRNMPVGEINWYASFASLFFIFFTMNIKQYQEKPAVLFVKFGGYLLLPTLIMQAIAVFERINAYGFTTPRCISLTLIVISIIFIIGTIIIPNHLNKIALLSGIIVLFVTVSPINVIDIPIKSQTKILETYLIKNTMLDNNTLIPKKDIKDEDALRIISAYKYLKYNAKKLPDYIPDDDKSVSEIFGFEKDYLNEADSYINCHFETKKSIDISEYTKMIAATDSNNIITIEYNNQEYKIDTKQIATEFYNLYGTENQELDIYKYNENIGLIFNNFNFNIQDGDVSYCYFNGYVLLTD